MLENQQISESYHNLLEMMQEYTHGHGKRKRVKKNVQIVSPHLLGFERQEYEQAYDEPRRRAPRKQLSHAERQKRKFNFRTKFRFILDAQQVSNSELEHFDGTSWKEWNCVQQVIITVSARNPVICPVCLNRHEEITAPNITFCGHIFCWPCILMHFERSNRSDQCPICNEYVCRDELRSCSIISKSVVDVGQEISLVLRLREPHQVLIYDPQTLEEDFLFSRFVRAERAYLEQRFTQERSELEKYELEYLSEGLTEQLPFIKEAQTLSDKRLSHLVNNQKHKKQAGTTQNHLYSHSLPCSEDSAIHFYQEQFGRMAFLHPICHKFLINQRQLNKELPLRIDQTIIAKQQITLDERNLRRYKYLNHLPENHEVTFIEINMKGLLNQDNYQGYVGEMGKHKAKIAEKEELEQKKSEEVNAKHQARREKERKLNNMEFWSDKVDQQLEDLKSCNIDEHFPVLESSFSFVDKLSNQSSITSKPLKEEEVIKQSADTAEDEFPELKKQDKQQLSKTRTSKKKKKNKGQRIDITSLIFDNEPQEL